MVKYVVKPNRRHSHFVEDENGESVRHISGPGDVVDLSPSQVLKFGDALTPYKEVYADVSTEVESEPEDPNVDGDKAIDNMTKGELLTYCEERDIEVSSNWNKPRILEAIIAATASSPDDSGDEGNGSDDGGGSSDGAEDENVE